MSIDQEKTGTTLRDWHKWCRLCAKEDARNVNTFLKEEFKCTTRTRQVEEKEEMLAKAMQKYFDVDTTSEWQQSLSQLCNECFSLIFSLVNFNQRVAKVQEMFNELHSLYKTTEMAILTLRSKYGVLESDRPHEITIPSTFDTNYEINEGEPILDIEIKEESLKFDTTATSDDEDVCDIENEHDEDNDDEDPFGSDDDVRQDVDKSTHSKTATDENGIENKQGTTNSNKEFLNVKKRELKPNAEKGVSVTANSQKTPEYKYFCSECPQRFQRIGSYTLHMRKKHGIADEPKNTCSKCSRSFKNPFNLKRHMETHRPTVEKKIFPCPQCDRKFQTKDYVATHIKFVHEDIRPLICEECGEGVRTVGALKEHMLTHTDYAPYECDVCKKCFKNQSRLKNHMDIHGTDKYECSECGMQLNSRVTLNRHMLVHSDVLQHKCDYCGRAFKRAKTLKSHLILHSGIKPYSCDFCDRTFTSGSNCRTHMKRQHPTELAELEASGGREHTKNIPKLAVLKSVMKKGDNLKPAASKRSGNFSGGKKPASQQHGESNGTKNISDKELVEALANEQHYGP